MRPDASRRDGFTAKRRPKWRFIKAKFDRCDNAAALFDPVLRMPTPAARPDAIEPFRVRLPSNPTLRERYSAGM
jgi:hypothetical protein